MYKRHCHVFKLKDQWYLFDVRSGAATIISPETAEIMLQPDPMDKDDTINILSNKYDPKELKKAWTELCQIGLLSATKPTVKPRSPMGEELPMSRMALHIAHDCNMRCQYCYAGKGSYAGSRELMSQTVAEKALNLLFSQRSDKIHIGFPGGEPLLNYKLLVWVVEEAEKRAVEQCKFITFSINTNGTLLTKNVAQYLVDHKFSIAVSLDGPPDIHDPMRPDSSGHGTYNRIVANIKPWLDSKADFLLIRPTFCGNVVALKKAIIHLFEIGAISVGGGFVLEAGSPYAVTEENLNQIQQQWLELIDDIFERNIHGGARTLPIITDKVEVLSGREYIDSGCGAGTTVVAVSPDGGLYPCHRLAGNSKVLLGTVDGFDEGKRSAYRQSRYARINNCESCWAKYLCAGRCLYQSIAANKAIEEPVDINCKINKMDWELALYALCKLRKSDVVSRKTV